VSATRTADGVPPRRDRWREVRKRVFAPGASLLLILVAVVSWISWIATGAICSNATDLHRGTARGSICEMQHPHWHIAAGGASPGDRLYELGLIALPVAILLGGIAASALHQRQRPIWFALIFALALCILPLIGLVSR
jgi:hypothetical protein